MNQRFQNAEISRVSKEYAEDELYKAICSIGSQLEAESQEFGLCPEECFMETRELLSTIAEKGEDIISDADNLWLLKHNEYKRFDRHISEDELRKAVCTVFGFVILALDSSSYSFYRYTLTEHLTYIISNHKFDGWTAILNRIFLVPLSDGWFDTFINKETEENDATQLPLPKTINTKRAQKYFQKAIEMGYMKYEDGKFEWKGVGDRGKVSQLAYFCGRIYNYKNSFDGNIGENFPEEELNKLFGVSRLYSSLVQVYNAQKPQQWRTLIDDLFE